MAVVFAAFVLFHAEARRAHSAVQPRVTACLGEDAPIQGASAPQRNDEPGRDDDEDVVERVGLPACARALVGAPAEHWQQAQDCGVRPHEGDGRGCPPASHTHRVLQRVNDGDVSVDGDGEDVGDGRQTEGEGRRGAIDAGRIAVEQRGGNDEVDGDDQ